MDASDDEDEGEDVLPPPGASSTLGRRTVGFRDEGREGDRLLRLEMQLAHLTDAFTRMACTSPGTLRSSPQLQALQQHPPQQAQAPNDPAAWAATTQQQQQLSEAAAAAQASQVGADYVEVSTQEAEQARQQAEQTAVQHASQAAQVAQTPAQGPATSAFRARQTASGSKHTPY